MSTATVKPGAKEVILVASGDSRIAANQRCWPAQQTLEKAVDKAFGELGARITRGHAYDAEKKHGFIDGQARGIQIFRKIDPEAPLVVAEAVWEYTSHVLAGLTKHRGPILTLANWSGEWPGLVGMLNVNASLTKAGIPYSSIWSEDFEDGFARGALRQWLAEGTIRHDTSHAQAIEDRTFNGNYAEDRARGAALGESLKRDQAILGVFDEGCMGMYNAIVPDDLMHGMGLFKERLSPVDALRRDARGAGRDGAASTTRGCTTRGMKFALGRDEATELTEWQVLEGLKMYDAAVRMADDFGCAAIGIQYQQGLKDICVASDLAEGLLNNPDRPPVAGADGKIALRRARRAALQRGRRVRRASTPCSRTACGWTSASIPRRRSTTCAGARRSRRAASTGSCGCSRSRARRRPRTSSAATAGRRANGSRRCTSRRAARR